MISRCKAQPAGKFLQTWGFISCLIRHCGSSLTVLAMTWELCSHLIAGKGFNVDFCRHYVKTVVT